MKLILVVILSLILKANCHLDKLHDTFTNAGAQIQGTIHNGLNKIASAVTGGFGFTGGFLGFGVNAGGHHEELPNVVIVEQEVQSPGGHNPNNHEGYQYGKGQLGINNYPLGHPHFPNNNVNGQGHHGFGSQGQHGYGGHGQSGYGENGQQGNGNHGQHGYGGHGQYGHGGQEQHGYGGHGQHGHRDHGQHGHGGHGHNQQGYSYGNNQGELNQGTGQNNLENGQQNHGQHQGQNQNNNQQGHGQDHIIEGAGQHHQNENQASVTEHNTIRDPNYNGVNQPRPEPNGVTKPALTSGTGFTTKPIVLTTNKPSNDDIPLFVPLNQDNNPPKRNTEDTSEENFEIDIRFKDE